MNDAVEHLMTIYSGALDCGTEEFIEVPIYLPEGLNRSAAG